MKQIYHELECIFDDMRKLLYEISQHNPGIAGNHKKSISTLAVTMGQMAYQLNNLRINMLDKGNGNANT